jgi:hypothetical protein
MRLLTVPQPMGTVLSRPGLHGQPVLNRRFPVTSRNLGPVVLVAGYLDRSSMADPLVSSTLADAGLAPEQLPTEAAVAVAVLVDCHQAAGACCAPWGSTSASFFHLVLDDIRPLRAPVRLPLRPGLSELDAKEHAAVLTAL